jgi:dTDP-4-amino-4,6-dideoxygalactose transaminase
MATYDMIIEFENEIAKHTGSKYAVSTDSATNAIFLSLLYQKRYGYHTITIPSRTFLSVPMAIKNAGLKVRFEDIEWEGTYQLKPTPIIDSALRYKKDMYIPGSIMILSFQYRKHIPIGRGGMVLTDDIEMVKWLKMARFNGKHEGISRWEDKFEILGWDMYMTPEQAARGLLILNAMRPVDGDIGGSKDYPDLSHQEVFND